MSRFEAQLIREMLRQATEPTAPDDGGLVAVRTGALGHGAIPELMEPAAALARARLDAGRLEDAVEITAEPLEIVARKGTWIWASDLAPVRTEALLAAGRADEAAALVELFAQGIRGLDAPVPQASLLLCRALVGASASGFAAAATALDLLPRPYDALLARERQAGCLLDERRTADATELLSSVLAGLTGLGARRAAARVAESLRQLGVRSTWRGGTRGYGDELSPRELDVARLLVGGRTNREIAEALYLSPKTIARHLNSAMRKLDVSSRTALAVRVVELGLVSVAPH
jgi:DNA-binding CsgD family transcriptional regulator